MFLLKDSKVLSKYKGIYFVEAQHLWVQKFSKSSKEMSLKGDFRDRWIFAFGFSYVFHKKLRVNVSGHRCVFCYLKLKLTDFGKVARLDKRKSLYLSNR